MYTEKEAKKKWCPFGHREKHKFRELGISITPSEKCITSECMIWKWGLSPNDPDNPSSNLKGYCGISKG